jgi:penicillin-binding protein 2
MSQRPLFFWVLFSVLGLIFIARLFYLQVYRDDLKLSARNNVVRQERIYPGRGLIYDRDGRLLVGNQSAYDLMVIPHQIELADSADLARLLRISHADFKRRLEKARQYSRLKPSVFMRQISDDHFAQIREYLHRFEGFFPQKRILREYQYPHAANVLGFIGEASDRFIRNNPHYHSGDLIGKSGIEKSYEEVLRGKTGVRYKMVDVHNRVKGAFKGGAFDTLPQPGSDLTSSIDIELQRYGEALMQNKRGSIVALEPATGEILSLVTAPSYDPNLLVGRERSKHYNELYADSINKPLYDRGLLAQYPPGSPFKVINALVALEEGAITPRTSHVCHHGFHWGRLHVACHCGTSYPLDLIKGISKSCNNYFCRIFKATIESYPRAQEGLNAWAEKVKSFGLGQFLDNDLPTGRRGFVPTASYFDKAFGYTGWKAVSVISLAIGQGELVLTPIQMANMTAAIANRGFYYTPHIVKGIDGSPLAADNPLREKKETLVDSSHFPVVIKAMRKVFETGTARWSAHDSIPMCGKTGTAQNPHGQDHSIFIAFAPPKNPQIALSVVVENGYWGSRWAAPIASLMIEKYLTGEVDRPRLEKRMLEGDLREQYQEELEAKREKARKRREKQKDSTDA